ncbi:MAG: alpha-L-fucosidase [Clostridia bacterium]|nr:alpha-L-fucosidase [Clostridia bacterium]
MAVNRDRDALYASIHPSERQIAYQQTEFYGFIHFTVNTFTDREWGDGTESEAVFAPASLDARQWARTARDGGMKGLILTCKHHDGFCLWPSALTEHSVKNSPYKEGRGDVVAETAAACAEYGLKFGVYLSPWDRNNPSYGTGTPYNDYFIGQLTELLTNYGEVFSVWFDGACGEGPDGRRQVYDWDRYYRTVRALQPGACICVCGPDIRWCGNEAGDTRPSEWSVVPRRLCRAETVEAKSQREDSAAFRQRCITSSDMDLGSREALRQEDDLIWYPAEVNTSIRPGWFYHAAEDDQVKGFDVLRRIYLCSVGGNATFLLNLPPDRNGLIHPADAASLTELGRFVRGAFRDNLAQRAVFTAADALEGFGPDGLTQPGYDRYFRTAEGVYEARVDAAWTEPQRIRYVVLQENIRLGQRIERFDVVCDDGQGGDRLLYSGTTVGYKRIVELPETALVRRLSVIIRDARVFPTLAFFGAYGPYGGD